MLKLLFYFDHNEPNLEKLEPVKESDQDLPEFRFADALARQVSHIKTSKSH